MTAARKIPTEVQAPPKRSRMYDLIIEQMESADVDGFVQAANEYGDDHERALADIEAGRHPLQTRKQAR